MNGHKSISIFAVFNFSVLMAAGCASVHTLKRYGTLPPTVKEAMIVKLYGSEGEMANSGIYLNEGEPYSIVASGGAYSEFHGPMYLSKDFYWRPGSDKNHISPH